MQGHPYKTRTRANQKRRHEIADTIDDVPPQSSNKSTPLYRPVKEPFNEASAYQCLVQLEQELSQECDKYNSNEKQLDLTDVSYMKFTDVGKELFEQTNHPR